MDPCRIFAGNASRRLAQSICEHLEVPLGDAEVGRFEDGEVSVRFNENIRGGDVFIVQATGAPADNLMELLVMLDAAKRASARRVTAVMPYFGYARQDRKVKPRTPISAKLVADLITAAGANRVLAIDLHAGQIQGFFNIPFDHIYAMPVFMEALRTRFAHDAVVVSPDAGGVERARAYSKRLNAGLAIIDKRRSAANVSEVMHLIGDVDGKDAVIVDDMIDTAGTLAQAARACVEHGARSVAACATHAVLSGPALQRIEEAPLTEVFVTDTIPASEAVKQSKKFRFATVNRLLGEAVKRIHHGDSISSLFI